MEKEQQIKSEELENQVAKSLAKTPKKKVGRPKKKQVTEEQVSTIETENHAVEESNPTPKIKRFATYEEAFAYFLVIIQYRLLFIPGCIITHKQLPGRKQRVWLYEIIEETLKRQNWYWDSSDESTGEVQSHKVIRTKFKLEEIRDATTWELIDYNIRLVLNKTSFLSRGKRDFLMELFPWVDNFVAKEGEEVTMVLDDLLNLSPEHIIEQAKKSLKEANEENEVKPEITEENVTNKKV